MLTSFTDNDVLDSETREIVDIRKSGLIAQQVQTSRCSLRHRFSDEEGKRFVDFNKIHTPFMRIST